MRRNALIILGVVVLVWGALALALGSPGLRLSSGSEDSASAGSPSCLPRTLSHSAALAGTGVDVSPAPETGTANPRSEVSFLGAPASDIRDVLVTGASSGEHAGHLRAYSQGDGASFVPDEPFDEGERVIVHATIAGAGGERRVSFGFGVDTPYPTANVAGFPTAQAPGADYESFYTLPGVQAPLLTVTVPDRDPGAGDVFTTNGPSPGQYGPLIYAPDGRLVWFDKLSGGEAAADLNEQTYRGARALTWWKGRVLELGFGQGEDVVMNSRYQTVARVRAGNGLKADLHDFQLVGGDVAYVTAFNPIRCDLTAAGGARDGSIVDTAIQQIDMSTGLVRWEWHSLDHVGASESEVQAPSGPSPWDYFHLNSIDPLPDGDLLISARSTWAGYLLARGSGTILWRLGGNKSSFAMGPGTKMAWQHDGRMLGDGELTFFDDGSNPPIHSQSRGIRVKLEGHRARLVASYTHADPPLLAASQGNMQTLADGNVVIGYGGVPAISEYAPGGQLLFDAHLPYDQSFYRAYRHPWSATPATPPALVSSANNTDEETIVHASWNGATDVASWRVLAGKAPGSLTALVRMPATGFESATVLPKRYAYAQVQALDAAGHTLGTSAVVKTIAYKSSLAGGVGKG
jgi:hypothetical protein